MSWWGVALLGASSVMAFGGGLRLAGRSRRAAARSGTLLALLVTSVLLRYFPTLEVRWLPVGSYAHLRPWLSIVLALAFLGSSLPQLPERRKRVAVVFTIVFLAGLVGWDENEELGHFKDWG